VRKHYTGNYTIDGENQDTRIDVFLSEILPLSRSRIKKFIDNNSCKVNGKSVKPSYRLKINDVVEYSIEIKPEKTLEPVNINIDVIHSDNSIIVVNKQAGIVVHPGAGREEESIIAGILNKHKINTTIGAPLRPGIVHRLDKDTSGVMVIAKTDEVYYNLRKQFKDRTVKKEYRAVINGILPNDEGEINMNIKRHPTHRKEMHATPIRGKEAITRYKVIERFRNATYISCYPETGRTHQLRVHLAFLGYPIISDLTYGSRSELINRQALHAYRIDFTHPYSGKRVNFIADIPEDIRNLIKLLKNNQ
jgi:23S rRNA pseudouridine1911/1915/1917 synthase